MYHGQGNLQVGNHRQFFHDSAVFSDVKPSKSSGADIQFPNFSQEIPWPRGRILYLPGDSLWPFHPLVEGHLTIRKGHLTIPKRSQRIARWGLYYSHQKFNGTESQRSPREFSKLRKLLLDTQGFFGGSVQWVLWVRFLGLIHPYGSKDPLLWMHVFGYNLGAICIFWGGTTGSIGFFASEN